MKISLRYFTVLMRERERERERECVEVRGNEL